jgi:hypothetical protein
MKKAFWFAATALALSVGVTTPAAATVLDFSGAICNGAATCSDAALIDNGYGDIAGQLDVQYDRDITNASLSDRRLSWWDAEYNDLQGVAWGSTNDSAGTAEIFLQPLSGLSVTLLGFDLGAWQNAVLDTSYVIRSGAGAILASSGTITVGTGNVHSSFAFNLTSSDGIRIQWGPSSYNVGIDNIEFRIGQGGGAVPEPATWAMMISGFGMAGAMLRRRRMIAA